MKIEKLACPSCNAPLSGDFVPNQQTECTHCGTPLLLTDVQTDHPLFCLECHTLNASEVQFCVNCGHRLTIECVLCHTDNRADSDYCAKCGVHIWQARVRQQLLHEVSQRLRKERLALLKEKEARQQREKLERLILALDEPENHDFAIFQIKQMGLEAVEALIETLLHDEDVDARYGSARALGQIMDSQALKALSRARTTTVRALIAALNDVELPVRYWAAIALGQCRSNLAIEPLTQLLNESHQGLRQAAYTSLRQIGGQRVEQILSEHQPKKGWKFPF